MNKTCDFLVNAFFASFLAWTVGYGWFLLSDLNTINAILMLASMVWTCIAVIVAIVGGLVWAIRHVRISII